ncbi:MAG TPA: hypothetical protein DDW84_06530 [Phycisphaerales bacterium]|nr:MAG: hypothetical protein A2Y13_01380 [Planctomycetes bacterium GWC2_45_44]HBG78483.1 hypothetical protein [Phycisphaerales bacterium]HBR19960.1 hypothetical protein [Phycisphaerales bacterium]
MTEQTNTPRFCDNLLFLNVFKTFRIAVQPARLFTAFLAVIIIFAAGWLMDFTKTVVVSSQLTSRDLRMSRLTSSVTYPTELHCFIGAPDRVESFITNYKDRPGAEKQGVFEVLSGFCMTRFNQMVVSILTLKFDFAVLAVTESVLALIWAIKYHAVYTVIFLAFSLLVITVAGGAICRGAAMQFSKDQIPGITPCLKFSLNKFVSLFCALIAPAILVASLGYVLILLVGLTANIPYAGEIILALLFIWVLFLGLIIASVVIWALTGGTLMFGAMGYESSDSFDIICKTFIYLRTKPWQFILYSVAAAVYGAICYLFVRFVAFLTLVVSRYFLGVIMWTDAGQAQTIGKLDALWSEPEFFNLTGAVPNIVRTGTESIGAFVINLEILAVAGIVLAAAMSFYFSANSIIYCLLRKKADNVSLDEVFVEAQPPVQPEAQAVEEIAQPQQPE